MFEPLPESDEHHDYFTVATLIDITATNGTDQYPNGTENDKNFSNIIRNQRRNLTSFLQSISLRCNHIYITDPVPHYGGDLSKFGTHYKNGTIWTFNFGVEHKGVFDLPGQPGGGLANDLHNVPIITGLLETVSIEPAIIDTISSDRRNTIILK